MRTIVLTGVTGLIGRALLKYFLDSGDIIVGIIDRLTRYESFSLN